MKTQIQIKEELIEQFGVHFEKYYSIPPLASRILSTLILSSRERDLTFEELVAITGASKSSVSTNLHLLLESGKIVYYTKCGDRKKYFKPASLTERIKHHLTIIQSEQKLIKKLKKYEDKFDKKPLTKEDNEGVILYREYINNFENLIEEFIQKIEELESK